MKHKRFDGINIIPFVDIMLVLLAIVLTTSTLVEKKLIPVSLPDSSSKKIDIKNKNITITVKKDGELFWEQDPVTKPIMIEKIKNLKKDDTILINCDKDSRFENFVFILDSLKSQDLENISIVTKEND